MTCEVAIIIVVILVVLFYFPVALRTGKLNCYYILVIS